MCMYFLRQLTSNAGAREESYRICKFTESDLQYGPLSYHIRGIYMLVLFEENWFGKNSTCAVYSEDRSTCSLNSDAEVTTLKWVGQSQASRRNMLSPCKIVFPLEKMNHVCCSQVCLPLVIHKESDGSFHSLKVWTRTVAPITTLSLKRSGPPLPLTQ